MIQSLSTSRSWKKLPLEDDPNAVYVSEIEKTYLLEIIQTLPLCSVYVAEIEKTYLSEMIQSLSTSRRWKQLPLGDNPNSVYVAEIEKTYLLEIIQTLPHCHVYVAERAETSLLD